MTPYTTWHTAWSYLKSAMRLIACSFGAAGHLTVFVIGLAAAEFIGIIEELG